LATRTERVGAERDKLRTTALGRTVIEWLLSRFEDMVAYDFTAAMEAQLDDVAKGTRHWQTILTETWDRYKDRYDEIMATPAAGAGAGAGAGASSGKVTSYGDGYKMVISKKGPLFVYEPPAGGPVRFASVPATLSITTATRADAEAAFATATAAREGENLGDLDGEPVLRRSGRFGPYVTWRGHTLNCKSSDTLGDLSERLLAKADPATAAAAVDRLVGGYRIRRGPYGLYMFKVSASSTTARKPTFVSIPEATPWATLTPETAEQVYKLGLATKKAGSTATKKKTAAATAEDD
jgi:topoisomerase IA-like protein